MITIHILLIPNLHTLSILVDSLYYQIQVAVGVHGIPQRFTILRVSTPTEILFCTVVDEWDASTSKGEDCGTSKLSILIWVVAKEARVIVIINKKTEGIDIFEGQILNIVAVVDIYEAFTTSKYVTDRVVHGVVEKCCDVVLVWAYISWISVESLSHLENTRCLPVFSPEVFSDFRNGVNSDTIKVKSFYDIFYPILKVSAHIRIILIKVW